VNRMAFAVLPKPKSHATVSRLTSNTAKSGLPVGLLQRKCACGDHRHAGGECEECSRKRFGLQPKLKVSEPGDIYEREADRVANQVMTSPGRSAVTDAPQRIQRVATQANGGRNSTHASAKQVLSGPARPLEPALRGDMEQRFGYDFSRVRVHFGGAAEQSAREVNANAYTVGQDIVFGAGRFAPQTHEGRRLIAHELTHVVQQSGAPHNPVHQSSKGQDTPTQVPVSSAGGGVIQRSPADQAEAEKLVTLKTWCRDTERSGSQHDPSLQCYREIPGSEGYSGGDQVCFDKETGKFVEGSPDKISAVSGQTKGGFCDIPLSFTDPPNPFTKRGRRALGHGVADLCYENPKLCGRVFGGLSGLAMGIAVPKEGRGFGTFAIPAILGFVAEELSARGLPRLDRLARRHGFVPTISLGAGSNLGLAVGMGLEKRDSPLPVVPVNSYLSFSFDSSLALKGEDAFLAKVGVRIDPGKQGGLFALGSVGGGLAMEGRNLTGAISADVGVGFRAADFFDVQFVRETITGSERGGTYWLTVKVVAPQRVLEK
jgi:hypothetical protein